MREHTGSAFGAFGTFLRPAGFAQGPQRGRVPRHTLAPRVRVKKKIREEFFSPPEAAQRGSGFRLAAGVVLASDLDEFDHTGCVDGLSPLVRLLFRLRRAAWWSTVVSSGSWHPKALHTQGDVHREGDRRW